jgi:hypothetical protein
MGVSTPLCTLQYGAVMIVDPEEEFYPEEVAKLAADVRQQGLGLLVFGEWYNADVQAKMRFFDDNTRSWWTPITGGTAAGSSRRHLAHCMPVLQLYSRRCIATSATASFEHLPRWLTGSADADDTCVLGGRCIRPIWHLAHGFEEQPIHEPASRPCSVQAAPMCRH